MIRPIGHFTTGRTSLSAVAGVPSIENLLDLGIHGLIAALALWSLRRNRFGLRPSWLILALPGLALMSAAWSLAPTVTLGFSFELVAIYLLATLTASIFRADRDVGASILREALRLAVLLVALLCIVGLVFPHSADSAAVATPGDKRFTWPGEHPLVATAEIGFALLVTLFGTRGEIGLRGAMRIGLAALFGVCLYLGQSRTAFAGLVAAALFGVWFVSKGRGWPRRLALVGAIAAAVVLMASMFGGPITAYLYHGQSHQQVYGLNGRLGLWTFALDQLHTPGQWLFGYGLSSTRVFLASSVQWAGDAHGAWIELVLSLGFVGITLALVLVVTLGLRLFRSGPERPLASRAIPILFVYVLAMSPVATGFAAPGPEPGLGFALLAFCYVATAAPAPARSQSAARRGMPFAREFSPAPT
jgi:O-antigen ligase